MKREARFRSMKQTSEKPLSGRERQIMDIVYANGRSTAQEIQDALPDAPGYSAVRTHLRILEEKGHLTHTKSGASFVYSPTRPRQQAAQAALSQVVKTFFGNSLEQAMTALLTTADTRLSPDEIERLSALIESAREENRSETSAPTMKE